MYKINYQIGENSNTTMGHATLKEAFKEITNVSKIIKFNKITIEEYETNIEANL